MAKILDRKAGIAVAAQAYPEAARLLNDVAALRESIADHDGRLAFNDFRRAFDQLTPEHREVLILVGASGFSCEEAAGMIGVAEGTVKSRTSRARKRLAELMGLADGEDVLMGVDGNTMAVMGRSGQQAA